jgi:hypothetical protein
MKKIGRLVALVTLALGVLVTAGIDEMLLDTMV